MSLLTTAIGENQNFNSTDTQSPGFKELGAGCCGGRVPSKFAWKGFQNDLDACKAKCQSMEAKCEAIEYGWKNSKWCTVLPKGTDCGKLTAGKKDCGSGGGNTGVKTYQLLSTPETTAAPTTTETTPAPEAVEEGPLTPVGTNCNCGKRIKEYAKGKTAETCNDACDSNPSCKSFGYWTSTKSKGYCALFDTACSCDNDCSGEGATPTNVKGGWENDVYNKDKALCLTEAEPDAANMDMEEGPSEEAEDFPDLGAGCCANRDPANMLFKGMVADMDACKTKCSGMEDCGFIEYGWKNSKWCTVIPAGVDCSNLAAGPKDCGSGGGDNGVHTYQFGAFSAEATEATPEQCEKFSFDEKTYVPTTPTEVPGATATSVSNVFISHAGIFNGAYVNGKGKKVEVVRRKKGSKNQYLCGVHDDRYAKMVEVTIGLKNGKVTVAITGARYRAMTPVQAKDFFSTSEKFTKLWNIGSGQHIARSDRHAGYGIKGLTIKSCLENADAVKAGKEMDDLIDDFIDAQAGSEDACHSQLLEARHQLNQLHAMVADLARQVNATEEQIMVYDKMLEERLEEITELTDWKAKELDKCKVEKLKAQAMFAKLKVELDEMHSIASPSVAMDIKNGKLHEVSLAQQMSKHLTVKINAAGEDEAQELSALQTELAAHSAPTSTGHVLRRAKMPSKHDEAKISGLIEDTKQASTAFQSCIEAARGTRVALTLFGDEKPKKKSEAECQAEKEALQKTYVKAYVELSRLKAEYEELANSTACVDSTLEQYKNRKTPLQKEADKLATAINEKVAELQSLRPRLDSALSSEEQLRKQVVKLTKQCDNLGPTVSDLNKVREAIRALSACPGLSRVKFSLPKWVGTWATFQQDGKSKTDKETDAHMNRKCNQIAPGSRAAEVGEIQEQTVEGIPTTNTATSPLLGACPDCEGKEDKAFQGGHTRICWDSSAPLDFDSRRENCGTGRKAILCVMDRADIRQIPGEENATAASLPYSE
eukprot:gnl/MRDRNA2_/MRDRNA2_83252_c0_seq5.p1 gnl/MRDRNA2_/MRDRNA2_83252_c0~~gnl/MRDRNA2_/MRDRNA2_83252_c0_seq5.p1  ORF type:complete len:1125 (-),score=274.97 gnl/MRDRNA2_/MRDRNA2_83252_c0_seq5:41-3016(-)